MIALFNVNSKIGSFLYNREELYSSPGYILLEIN